MGWWLASILALLIVLLGLSKLAHAQVSAEIVPPGCYTSFEDDHLCWEPSGEILWGFVPDDHDYPVDFYGPVVGSLVNRYVDQYQVLLRWKKLARERGKRLLRLRSQIQQKRE
jgi:hypothetical protein